MAAIESTTPGSEASARTISEPLTDAIIALRGHYAKIVAPIWKTRGFDPVLHLPFEAVLTESVPAPQRFRAMACARQLFIFSELGDREHSDRLFDSLTRHFRDVRHGGFFYSIAPSGEPLETDKDLYTHAFVIFACAAYLLRFGVPAARLLLDETTAVVSSKFSTDSSTGLANAVLDSDFKSVRTGARQNPLMHLTEAYLLARQASGDTLYDALLTTLLDGIARHFVDAGSGCIMELPEAMPESWIEPGHQFEWFYLSEKSGHPAFRRSGLSDILPKAFTFARTFGVDRETGGVVASLDRSGCVVDHTQRIWAQTEYLRALTYRPDTSTTEELTDQIVRFQARFLHRNGWHECLGRDGEVSRNDMPSTTPYHLATAHQALDDVLASHSK